MTDNSFSSYLAILKIRQTSFRRDLIIAAVLLLTAILSTVGFGLLTDWKIRYISGMTGLDILLLIGVLMSWVRLEIVNGNIDLLKHL